VWIFVKQGLGILAAAIVVLLDPLKAALAVLIAIWLNVGPWGIALTGLATVLGNMFNPFLGFKGGKGVATSIGMFMPIDPLTALACICIGVFALTLYTHRQNLGRLAEGVESRIGAKPQ